MSESKRIKILELLKTPEKTGIGNYVTIKGWVRTKRGNKNVAFIALNDGSTIHSIQVVVDLANFDEELLKLVKFVVATRPGYPLAKIPSYVRRVGIRAVDVSAFEVREAIRHGKSFRYLVPDAVFAYINKKRLYR